MKRAILFATAALAAGLASAPASAQSTLNVQGVVVPFCNINLTNVSSGTASVAMSGEQQVANLRLACNAASGTKLTMTVTNGDLKDGNNLINYGVRIASPSDSNFNLPETDTSPTNKVFSVQRNTYSSTVAGGIPLALWLNLNVNPGEPQAAGSQLFPASQAPAGTYTETFAFTATSV